QDLPAGGRPAREPLRRGRAPGRRDGHVLREPGSLRRTHRARARVDGSGRLSRPDRDRQEDRRPQVEDDESGDRSSESGPGPLSCLLGRGDVALAAPEASVRRSTGLRSVHIIALAAAFALGIGGTLLYQNRSWLTRTSGSRSAPPVVLVGLDGADWN